MPRASAAALGRRIGSVSSIWRKQKAAITAKEFHQDSEPAAIQQAIQQKAPQSPSESSVSAIKASPLLSEDAKLATTAGNNERTTAIADWRDITVIHKQAADRARDMFSTMLDLACLYPGKTLLPEN
jgi:hypothetical protein